MKNRNLQTVLAVATVCLIGVSVSMAQNYEYGSSYKDFSVREMGGFFIPEPLFMCADAEEKIFSLLYDEDDCIVGFGVLNKNLECKKEFRTYTPSDAAHIREYKYAGDTNWIESYRDTYKNGCPVIGYFDASDALLFDVFAGGDDPNTLVNVTQTLFNDDEAYELIQPVYGESRIVEYDEDFTYRHIYINDKVTEFNIVDENGKVLYAIKPKSGFFFNDNPNVLRLGNKYYFVAVMRDMADPESLRTVCFYEINKAANSVSLVRELRK